MWALNVYIQKLLFHESLVFEAIYTYILDGIITYTPGDIKQEIYHLDHDKGDVFAYML